MTPADAIAALDRQIAKHGQAIVLSRLVKGGDPLERPHRAFVRGYRPDELSGGIQQGDTLLVISPTGMPAEFAGDANRLKAVDRIAFGGRVRNVQFVVPVTMGDTLVRLNVTVRG